MMKHTFLASRLNVVCVSLLLAGFSAQATDYYVSTQGSDSNPGTSSAPLRTITRAYSLASAGSTIYVSPGTYTDYSSGWGLHLGKSGTSSSPITLKSTVRGGAIIDGQNVTDRNEAIYIDGSYNVVDGFVIRNGPHGGLAVYGNGNRIINNEIGNNGNPDTGSANGQDGVYSNQGTSNNYYGNNYIHDNGRTGSNLDHGLYLCGVNETVVNNVLLRNAATAIQVAGYSTVRNLKIYNNVVAYSGTTGIILWMSLSGVDIKNNIIYRNGSWGIGSYDAHGSGVVADHNIFYGNGSGAYNFSNAGSDYSYSLGTVLTSDPQLVNGNSSGFDAHLRSTSPCIKAGLNLYSVFTTDKDGAARPSSGSWDLGAYAYGGSTPTAAAPTISSIPNQSITAGNSAGPLSFTVNDSDTSASSLVVTASSSNPTLVPNSNVALGGSGNNRTVTVTPASGQSGTATITLQVSDGQLSSKTSFVLTVNPALAPVITLTSPANGASYTAPASISLAASVTANGHTITKVQFYNGSALLAEDTGSPYTFSFNNVTAGSYALRAVAVYDSGNTVSSTTINVTVNAAPSTTPSGLKFASTSGSLSAPFYVTNGAICQDINTTVTAGGRAVYAFTVASAGDYTISALVNAPSTDNNSLYVNMDVEPSDPLMIWDIPVTSGQESRTVSWRGAGTIDANEFAPKVFTLSAGTHQLIIRGREANCQLGNITIASNGTTTPPTNPPPPVTPPSVALSSPVTGANYTAPASINLAADVTANGQTITKVQFYGGTTLLGESTAAPYAFTYNNVSAGTYALAAVAVYGQGSTVSSPAVNVTVTPAVTPPAAGLSFASTSGSISAPFYVTNGIICQDINTTVTAGGRAVYAFTVASAGDYTISALVNAPSTDNNSLYVNMDVEPSDPLMIWDIAVTSGQESRTVSWRGAGTIDANEFAPKVFTLSAGTHQLIIRGREANCELGNLSVTPYGTTTPTNLPPTVTPPSIALTTPVDGASYTVPASIDLAANVTVNGQTITKVQFYSGATLLGESTTAPYAFTDNNVNPGSYALTAVAVYGQGSMVSSPVVNVTVNQATPPPAASVSFAANSGSITAPFVVSNGVVSQPAYTSVTAGGRAAYTFTVPSTGDYTISALVNAPNTDYNSFFVNIDAEPVDPLMIWDIPVTSGEQSQAVSWRGAGTVDANQFAPKVFNLTAGTHQLIVRGREGNCTLGAITISPANVLPAPWQAIDIGNVGITGASSSTSGNYSVSGAGSISGTADAFRFVYQTLSDDGEIRAQISSVQNTGTSGCLGLMIRENLSSGSKCGLVGISPDGTSRWQVRTSTSGTLSSTTGPQVTPPNCWIRLVRTGDTLQGFLSIDGTNWTSAGSASNVMASTIYFGLAVASDSTTAVNTGRFSSVTAIP